MASHFLREKAFGKATIDAYLNMLLSVRQSMMRLNIENVKLRSALEGRDEVINEVRLGFKRLTEGVTTGLAARPAPPPVPQPAVPSFAGAVRTGLRDPPPRNVVFVKKEGLSSQELKKKLKECVVPKRDGVSVVRATSIRSSLVIEVDSRESCRRLMESAAVKEGGLEVTCPTKMRPVVMIYDIDRTLTEMTSRMRTMGGT